MNVKFKGNSMTLTGKLLHEGDKIDFHATKTDFSSFDFKDLKGVKVISTIPSINTSVCDLQTRKIEKIAKKYPEISFVTISLDLPTAQANWCSVNKINNLLIVSDYKEREFSKKYGLLIDQLKLIHRSLIIVSKDDIVLKVLIKEEMTKSPDFRELKSYLKKLN